MYFFLLIFEFREGYTEKYKVHVFGVWTKYMYFSPIFKDGVSSYISEVM